VKYHQYLLINCVDANFCSILCNTSGAGKTRLIFEGLCKHWGFYFVAAQDTNGIGAPDLEIMIERMGTSSGWTDDIFKDGEVKDFQSATRNNSIARNRLLKVLLARWIVFRAFIEVAKDLNAGVLPDHFKIDWLLFQILPRVSIGDRVAMDGQHPFVVLINDYLVGASTDVLEQLLDKLKPLTVLGSAFDPERDTFFYVLDEAQVAGEQHMGAFADASSQLRRPVLRPIVGALTASKSQLIKLIISGTGFSLGLFQTVITSGQCKAPDLWNVVHTIGDFTDQSIHKLYISRYLPPSFLCSQSGTALITRMFEWLRGR
jgi:hypothetical protein